MKPARRLVLKKETLVELSPTELHHVAAGAQALTPQCPTGYCVPTWNICITTELSRAMDPCVTAGC